MWPGLPHRARLVPGAQAALEQRWSRAGALAWAAEPPEVCRFRSGGSVHPGGHPACPSGFRGRGLSSTSRCPGVCGKVQEQHVTLDNRGLALFHSVYYGPKT